MDRVVNIHHKRFADFIHFLKENEAEIILHPKDAEGHASSTLTYSFKRGGDLKIKALVCQAIGEDERIAGEYFRTNLVASTTRTNKVKAFFNKCHFIFDITWQFRDGAKHPGNVNLMQGKPISLDLFEEAFPNFFNHLYTNVLGILKRFQQGAFPVLPVEPYTPYNEELGIMNRFLNDIRNNEDFIHELSQTISRLEDINSPINDWLYVDNPNFSKPYLHRYSLYNLTSSNGLTISGNSNSLNSNMFSDTINWSIDDLVKLLFAFAEYQSLKEVSEQYLHHDIGLMRFNIHASTEGKTIDYEKVNQSISELSDLLTLFHFNGDVGGNFRVSGRSILGERLIRNDTGEFHPDIHEEKITTEIINTLKQAYQKAFVTSVL